MSLPIALLLADATLLAVAVWLSIAPKLSNPARGRR